MSSVSITRYRSNSLGIFYMPWKRWKSRIQTVVVKRFDRPDLEFEGRRVLTLRNMDIGILWDWKVYATTEGQYVLVSANGLVYVYDSMDDMENRIGWNKISKRVREGLGLRSTVTVSEMLAEGNK